MEEFGYLSVIISVIIGLSITQLLQGIGQVINARDRVRIYWPTMAWAVFLLLVDTQAWWAMFGYRNRQAWTFVQFTVVLLEAIMLYLLAAIVLPNIPDEGEVDLRKNYFRHAGWFFGSLVVLLLDSLFKSVVISGGLPGKPDLGFHLFWITTALVAAFTRNERYHKAFVCLSFAVFIAYIALLFPWLR
ncbi:MAG: hypothetical protein ACM3KL_03265 [Alphaproteobacteria bacterium]